MVPLRLSPRLVATLVGLLATASALPTARAEVNWLHPERFSATPGAALWVQWAAGEEFGGIAGLPAGRSVAGVRATLGEHALPVVGPARFGEMVRCTVTLPRPGVVRIASELEPFVRSFSDADLGRYFREVYATDELRDALRPLALEGPVRELRRVRARVFLRVGEPVEAGEGWGAAESTGLDLVPLQDPTNVRENERLSVRVTLDGHPAPGVLVAFVARGLAREYVAIADADGQAAVRCDAPGPWLVQAVVAQRSPDPAAHVATWVAAVTIDVREQVGGP